MLSHKIGVFCTTGNIIILGDYPEHENTDYLSKVLNVSFNFDGDVQSIGFHLQVPNKNRLANIYLYDQPADDVIAMNNRGQRAKPMGAFQVKLSYDGRTDIWPMA